MPRRPRHATVVAYLALFVALSGSAYAATRIGSKQITDNSVQSRDIRNGTIATKDISSAARKALKGTAGARGAAGAAGTQGPAGAPGAPGAPGAAGAPGASAVPARTVVVGAGGTPTENGAALRAALTTLPAASTAEPRAVVLGAGRYDVAGNGVTVPADVTLSGAGTSATVIDSSPANVQISVVSLAARTGLRDLTVTTASASLGSTGVDETAGNDGTIERVAVSAGIGIVKRGGLILDSSVTGFGTAVRSLVPVSGRFLNLTGSQLNAFGTGVARALSTSTTMSVSGSRLFAASTGGAATGVYADTNGTVEVRDTTISVNGSQSPRGILLDSTQTGARVDVDTSHVEALGAGAVAVTADTGKVRVGATKLDATTPATEVGSGVVSCIQTYSSQGAAVNC